MTTRTRHLKRVAAASFSLVLLTACGTDSTGESVPEGGSTPTATAGELGQAPDAPSLDVASAAAWEALMSSDGEYAAYAAYSAVIEKFGEVEPYVAIRAAELRHVEALIRQLERRGVSVPENPYLGEMTAPDDLATAATAWAEGEVANVALYDELLTQASGDATLTRVLTNLRRASLEMHLPAFRAAADSGGVLSTQQMDELGLH